MTNPGSTLLAVHLDRSSMLRPLLPALRAGLVDLLDAQAAEPGSLQVVLSTGDDLTRSLADGSHPPATPVDAGGARTALATKLRPVDGPDLRIGAARLLDAVGDELAARAEDDRPERVVVLLVGEAAVGDPSHVRERIAHQRSTYAWEVALVDVTSGGIPAAKRPEPAGPAEAATEQAEGATDDGQGTAAVALAERMDGPAAAARFGVPAPATITAGPGAAGVTAALSAATAFVSRARAVQPHEPVDGFSDDERAAAAVADTRPAWRRFLRIA
ncbi:hypothetical protein Ae168Ps1_0895c [Pseudonocardia sp. Ae168_Ps1]|uniref:hypothetical protein n=1 Tax=unclassified Pseudonocardia TaxID=2619320 RepID=UPI0009600CC3|nr:MULTISPECIES: hypothetical protein [unclassified Pseudonocardia]OLL72517.1 hypothetical protein Ae150APs1_0895c [Pseudonocardia sp. Ae150A_Ps1]OLL78489.1 hypothetical protein Ae168Ps1_0895c [Pseudonocardia sp. Ae168_Ps1]OLL87386.1 hypothetical protein Ae263Ps1_4441 [Pseudonocardia sp. Ae263_Ps1]OLL92585.1 hypothetical protein Ae356Ps1_2482c [Pseudonocardia sp. Ae356_Ps1]